jgi:hypothetical protein
MTGALCSVRQVNMTMTWSRHSRRIDPTSRRHVHARAPETVRRGLLMQRVQKMQEFVADAEAPALPAESQVDQD